MTNQTPEIELFFKEWSNEFSRSIEMFTGQKAAVSYTVLAAGETETRQDLAGYLWWKQVFERNGQLAYWIGADESAWNTLGSSAEGTPNDPQRAYLEMIGQANQAIAAVVSRRTPQPLTAKEGSVGAQPQMNSVVAAEISVSFKENTLTPLIAALDATADVLAAGDTALAVQHPGASGQPYAPMLQRLMDLELPLSIGLGSAVLPVRDVLKMTSGSLIELDRNVGEYVDLIVHGTVVARGEVVSVKGNYGVRIKQIISRQDRLALHSEA
jgi:flagellar motor switch protein FliN/FliY